MKKSFQGYEKKPHETQEETAEALAIQNAAPLETSAKVFFFALGMFPIPLVLAIALFYIILKRNKRGTEKTSQSFIWLFFGFCGLLGAMVLYVLYLLFFRWAPSIVSP